MRRIDYIVLHCTAGSQNQSIASIKSFWKNTLGWKNPGYHFIIKANGEIVQLAPLSQIVNGVKGKNANSIHISYTGGQHGIDNRTCEQKEAQEKKVRELKCQFPNAKVVGHRDLSPDLNGDGIIQSNEWTKLCPSFDVAKWLKSIGLVLACLFIVGCGGSKRPIVESVSTIDSTTVTKSVRLRDTIVRTPYYKIGVFKSIKDLVSSKDPITSNKGNATVSLWAENDTIYATAECDSLEIQLQLRDSIINTLRQRLTEKTTVQQVKYIPWTVKALAWIGGIAVFITVAFVAYKIFKPKFL
tara:strand:- start:358 stop:1254 length:897 start_codon:yes stop_codon:yes gene_type:complete